MERKRDRSQARVWKLKRERMGDRESLGLEERNG